MNTEHGLAVSRSVPQLPFTRIPLAWLVLHSLALHYMIWKIKHLSQGDTYLHISHSEKLPNCQISKTRHTLSHVAQLFLLSNYEMNDLKLENLKSKLLPLFLVHLRD